MRTPQRIVCLTEETVETLYLLGEEDRIVGISGYTVRPPQARRDKPKVSAFTSAKIEKILELKPDLVLTFSDLQADIVADLVRRGIEVHAFNQRDLDGILRMIETLGMLIGAGERAERLIARLNAGLEDARKRAARLPKHPKVFFEEWNEPLISAIGWVSRTDRDCGRRRHLRRTCGRQGCEGPPRHPRGGYRPRAGHRHRFMVRETLRAREGARPARLRSCACGCRRRASRDQVLHHPAAGPSRAHRWVGGAASDHRPLGGGLRFLPLSLLTMPC